MLLNGSKGLSFTPSEGLSQGDPLSPYLFILVNEVLSRLINREVAWGNISVTKISNTAPKISKLLYADDVLVFCGAKMSKLNILMQCLNTYCAWSGQMISIEKSGVFASAGVHPQFLKQIKNQWGLKKVHQGVKYLGVPLFLSNSKKRDFSYVKDKLESKVSSWKCKNLSWMGRATLIKSVAEASPMYTMSAFQVPKGICDAMDGIVRRFWWKP